MRQCFYERILLKNNPIVEASVDIHCTYGDEEILENFVKSITINTKELDPDFSKFVDDNFWDLV